MARLLAGFAEALFVQAKTHRTILDLQTLNIVRLAYCKIKTPNILMVFLVLFTKKKKKEIMRLLTIAFGRLDSRAKVLKES